ncbi:MAG: hypothetical protein IMZ61_15990 [Planctomycetes bacterium]|nr:hypothetical protein [Planctomycetota bacterium]
MDLTKARRLVSHNRRNIGRLLRLAQEGQRVGEDLSKTFADLKRLYTQYPEIKPIRVKQLSLFNQRSF